MIKKLDNLAILLLVISGIVWGLIGLYRLNLVTYVFDREWVIRIVYVLFGLSMIYHLILRKSRTKRSTSRR